MKRKIIALKKKIHGENDDEYFDKLINGKSNPVPFSEINESLSEISFQNS